MKFEPYIEPPRLDPVDKWLRRFVLWIGVPFGLFLLFLLGGCATQSGFDYAWTKQREASARPWFYVKVADPDTVCRMLGASTMYLGRINACATWKPQGCVIYVTANAPAWIIAHEERHCMGWGHP